MKISGNDWPVRHRDHSFSLAISKVKVPYADSACMHGALEWHMIQVELTWLNFRRTGRGHTWPSISSRLGLNEQYLMNACSG